MQRGQRLRDLARALPRAEALLDGPRQRLDHMGLRLPAALKGMTDARRVQLTQASAGLRPHVLASRIAPQRDRVEAAGARLDRAFATLTDSHRKRLDALERMRQTLGYTETLRRGYAVVRGDGEVVTTKAAAGKAGALEIEFADGVLAVGEGSAPPGSGSGSGSGSGKVTPPKAKPAKKPNPPAPEQGSLF
jgi:exodeoxyribonuclease VII large subunit